jgi:salicylate hydroxylase
MDTQWMVVGGGLAGWGAALALARAGQGTTVLEQAPVFAEVGAGIQLGPNAVRVLHSWGLAQALAPVLTHPESLRVHDALDGRELGRLRLGATAQARYGQAYATVHRADLHRVLVQAAQQTGRVAAVLDSRVERVQSGPDGVRVQTAAGQAWNAQVVLGCDGLWSRVRQQLWADGSPFFTGHLAYRGLVPVADVPAASRSPEVRVWLGPRLHVVHYPVMAGRMLNVVAVVHGELPTGPLGWDHAGHAQALHKALGPVTPGLQGVLSAVADWGLWPLHVRAALAGPAGHCRGRVALLGDAAHPMRPYLAQGAAMALEDAWALARQPGAHTPAGLQAWARQRWARNAWVQARSQRNGVVFHARGPLRWARDAAMRVLGERLLDQPRLYGGPPSA